MERFWYFWLTAKKWKWLIVEIQMKVIDQIETWHIIKLFRPKVDEASIRHQVRSRWADQLKSSLWSEDIREKVEKETEEEIKEAYEKNRLLPPPLLFIWRTKETKIDGSIMKLKIEVSIPVATYFIEHLEDIEEMKIGIERLPVPLDSWRFAEEIVDYQTDFISEVEDWISLDQFISS